MIKTAIPAGALALLGLFASPSQDPQDPKASRAAPDEELAAILQVGNDYVDALYQCKPDLIRRSVHPELAKLGFYRDEPGGEHRELKMTFDQLVKLAGGWNRDGKQAGDDAVRKVELLDRLDRTAVLKVTAVWGIDYMHVGRFGDKWQAVHILWQSAPERGR